MESQLDQHNLPHNMIVVGGEGERGGVDEQINKQNHMHGYMENVQQNDSYSGSYTENRTINGAKNDGIRDKRLEPNCHVDMIQ